MVNSLYKILHIKRIYRALFKSLFIFLGLFLFTGFILYDAGYRCSVSDDFYITTFGIYFSLLLLCYFHFVNLKYVINVVISTFYVLIFLNILSLFYFLFLDTSLINLDSVIFAFGDNLIITRVYSFDQLYAGAVLYCKNNNYNIDFRDIGRITLYGKNMEEIKLKLTEFNLVLKAEEDSAFWTKSMYLVGGILGTFLIVGGCFYIYTDLLGFVVGKHNHVVDAIMELINTNEMTVDKIDTLRLTTIKRDQKLAITAKMLTEIVSQIFTNGSKTSEALLAQQKEMRAVLVDLLADATRLIKSEDGEDSL